MNSIKIIKIIKCGFVFTSLFTAMAVAAESSTEEPKSPYLLTLTYSGEPWENLRGGLKRGFTYLNNFDVKFLLDADRAYGCTKSSIYFEGFYESAPSLDMQLVGALDQQSP